MSIMSLNKKQMIELVSKTINDFEPNSIKINLSLASTINRLKTIKNFEVNTYTFTDQI